MFFWGAIVLILIDSKLLVSVAACYFADFEQVKKVNKHFDYFKQITN